MKSPFAVLVPWPKRVSLCAQLLQSCLTLCNPIDCRLTGSSLSMGFSRQEHWSGLPFTSPGDLPNPRIKPRTSALQAYFTKVCLMPLYKSTTSAGLSHLCAFAYAAPAARDAVSCTSVSFHVRTYSALPLGCLWFHGSLSPLNLHPRIYLRLLITFPLLF